MSQVDNRNSSAAKRARTDGVSIHIGVSKVDNCLQAFSDMSLLELFMILGGRREDDWTCPSCGNVNFSFRTTCNMRNCTQPRPADHNSKSAPKPMQTPQAYSSAAPYVGPGAPSSMYIGVPPYGSSLFNGSSMPPYDVPFSGGSAYHYNYGSRISGGSPYRPLHLSAPPPYSGGSMIGNDGMCHSNSSTFDSFVYFYSGTIVGIHLILLPIFYVVQDLTTNVMFFSASFSGMYGVPPLMDRYGLALPMGHNAMGPRPGFYPEEKVPKKDGKSDNDWKCPKCGNVNFSFRTVCNMRKCNTPKPGAQAAKPGKSSSKLIFLYFAKPDMPDGSWKCDKCNNINYPFRTKCNRQNCGAEKPSESQKSPSEEAEENDQVCLVICLVQLNLLSTRTCSRVVEQLPSIGLKVGHVVVVVFFMLLRFSSYSLMVCVVNLY
ncbi:Zinc finger, RanBP2-type [Cynara cardunculus var. scolymus]|uniref:Zinc finger, RanBP2-type n=1 Tax=Cynara cardunculus var. scolymus TaxID=59895 RepID=A0A103YAX0_CYNCS|nr:Zinc finger, RanBP2-type [Cynara cardunculus var. scolymus]